jgi:hypothetical protein
MTRARLGSWTCPSGTIVTAFLEADTGAPLREGTVECRPAAPLSEEDRAYVGVWVRSAIVAATKEYLELTGPGLVLQR